MSNRLTEIIPDAFDDAPATERNAAEIAALAAAAGDASDGAFMSQSIFEQFHCEPCQAAMNREMVLSEIIGEKIGSPARITRGFCLHCQRLYEVIFVLQGGVWHPLDHGRVVTDQKLVRRHFAHVKTRLRPNAA